MWPVRFLNSTTHKSSPSKSDYYLSTLKTKLRGLASLPQMGLLRMAYKLEFAAYLLHLVPSVVSFMRTV